MELVRIEPETERYFNLDLVSEVLFQDGKAYVVLSNGANFKVTEPETMQRLKPAVIEAAEEPKPPAQQPQRRRRKR